MSPQQFIERYQAALAAQSWSRVLPLVSSDVCVTFSDGGKHIGVDAVEKAYTKNFESIKGEHFVIENVLWIKRELDYAAYFFDYQWSGMVKGQYVSGKGVGTTIIVKEGEKWLLLAEHLSKKA